MNKSCLFLMKIVYIIYLQFYKKLKLYKICRAMQALDNNGRPNLMNRT